MRSAALTRSRRSSRKTVPKELLPVVDTPGIELVATEAADSGAQRLVIVTSPGKNVIHLDLHADDRQAQVDRALALGAEHRGEFDEYGVRWTTDAETAGGAGRGRRGDRARRFVRPRPDPQRRHPLRSARARTR
ncbi:VOC family protein, partial [Nocardia farcinica]|uniref:VOC family protein n=1 Tax=Nocardia farcinica TaxID=37329 RepID=UPI003CC800B1